jgi:hypothetical protein
MIILAYATAQMSKDISQVARYVSGPTSFFLIVTHIFLEVRLTEGLGKLSSIQFAIYIEPVRRRTQRTLPHVDLSRFSADGLGQKNQTNLAFKGIVAVKAMSEICTLVNQISDSASFLVKACVLNQSRGSN